MTPLYLVPGLLCDGELFAAQKIALDGRTEVVVFDPAPYASIEAMAQALLDQAPAKLALAGFSLGGWVAVRAVGLAPERFAALGLLSCSPHALAPRVAEQLEHSIELLEEGGLGAYLEAAFPLYVAPARAGDQALRTVFDRMGHRVGVEAGVRGIRALLGETVHPADVRSIACPTAVVGGAEDERVTPAMHEEFAAAIPGATVTLVPRAGHFKPIEEPDAVSQALLRLLGA